jgi:hypothetical protein
LLKRFSEEDRPVVSYLSSQKEFYMMTTLVNTLIIKSLLQAVEEANIPRNEIKFLDLCNENILAFGTRASKLRRELQLRWHKIKTKEIRSYKKLLDKLDVTPSPCTIHQLYTAHMGNARSNKNDDDASQQSTITTEEQNEEESESEEDSGEEIEDDEGEQEEEMKPRLSSAQKRAARKPAADTPTRSTPTRRKARRTPTRSPNQTPTRTPPRRRLDSYSSKSATTPTYAFGETARLNQGAKTFSWSNYMNGTLKNPWRCPVDLNFPERHVNGLDVQFVSNMKHQGSSGKEYLHDGFHIRRMVAVLDFALWEAKIPAWGSYPPEFEERVLLIKGPSRDHWIHDTESYHETKRVQCDSTKTANQATQMAIEADQHDREFSYTLLLFDENIKLDNTIFSDDGHNLTTIINPLNKKGKENETKKDLYSTVVFWRIAIAGGKKLTNVSKKFTAQDLFA